MRNAELPDNRRPLIDFTLVLVYDLLQKPLNVASQYWAVARAQDLYPERVDCALDAFESQRKVVPLLVLWRAPGEVHTKMLLLSFTRWPMCQAPGNIAERTLTYRRAEAHQGFVIERRSKETQMVTPEERSRSQMEQRD